MTRLDIPDICLIEPEIHYDERGYFFESFCQHLFNEMVGQNICFVQENHSKSSKGVLRGLHYQLPPMAQGKLVRVLLGEIFDVVLDVRKSSPTCGKWVGEVLSAENKRQLWIPDGFAHGFVTLSDTAEILYKTTNYYAPGAERCIRWDDPQLAIKWHFAGVPQVSAKDAQGETFAQAEIFYGKVAIS